MNFNRLIEIAYALREKTVITGRCAHITIILNKSKILSIATNNYNKSHFEMRRFGYKKYHGIHSEMRAALKLGLDSCNGLVLVNFRIDNNNRLANSRPCLACSNLIRELSFKSVYYSDSYGQIQKFIN